MKIPLSSMRLLCTETWSTNFRSLNPIKLFKHVSRFTCIEWWHTLENIFLSLPQNCFQEPINSLKNIPCVYTSEKKKIGKSFSFWKCISIETSIHIKYFNIVNSSFPGKTWKALAILKCCILVFVDKDMLITGHLERPFSTV